MVKLAERTTCSGGLVLSGPWSRLMSSSTAACPMAAIGWATVVSGGTEWAARSTSS